MEIKDINTGIERLEEVRGGLYSSVSQLGLQLGGNTATSQASGFGVGNSTASGVTQIAPQAFSQNASVQARELDVDHPAFARLLVGRYRRVGCSHEFVPPLAFPGEPNLIVSDIDVEPFDAEGPEGSLVTTLTSGTNRYPAAGAKVTAVYESLFDADNRPRDDLPGVPTGTYLTYEADLGFEQFATPSRRWRWNAPPDYPTLAADVEPSLLLPTGDFRLTWHRVAVPPWTAIRSLRGHVNVGETALPANHEVVLENLSGNAMEIVAEIAAASEEQSSGIEQVNKAVMQLDELTQQNAAMVEEATASSQAQADLANSLHQLVSRYRINRDDEFAASPVKALPSNPAPRQAATPAPAVERRGPNRPWGDRAPAAKPAARSAAATGTDDTEWEEF